MELSEILDSLSGAGQTKTAAYSSNNQGNLSSAIDRALGSSGHEKTAGYENAPSQDLIKIAQDLSNAEQHALIKEAHIYGRAVADGFAARMDSYSGGGHNKYAQDSTDAETVKQAMELGYIHATNALHKVSQPQRGRSNVKTASHRQQAHSVKVAAHQQGQAQAVKVAAYLQGKEQASLAVQSLLKIGHDYEAYGFKVGNSILRRL
jgi:hypothetical protein